MPELPEVETIARELRDEILSREIAGARLLRQDILKHPDSGSVDFAAFFKNRRFSAIDRLGKFLMFMLNDGARFIAHLGMTGKFVVSKDDAPNPDHLCSQIHFKGGGRLDHVDVRRFGRLELYSSGESIPLFDRIGFDPLSLEFGPDALRPFVYARDGKTHRKRAIHTLLLDQSLISGVGNIYACEALFRAGIKPQRYGGRLSLADRQRLAESLRSVMLDALRSGGTTVNDYRRVDDKPGNFRELLQVYDRAGQPCRACGAEIKRIRINARSAYYCPDCQKVKK